MIVDRFLEAFILYLHTNEDEIMILFKATRTLVLKLGRSQYF